MRNLYLLLVVISSMMAYSSCAQKNKPEMKNAKVNKDLSKLSQATFASGCFWHEEALFESVRGVQEAISGYAGGTTDSPTYERVEAGNTGHAETVNVYYDSTEVSYETLLKIYFASQDPTSADGQAPDFGTQYRSIIFYRNNDEKSKIEKYISQLNASEKYSKPIAVQIMSFTKFWPAERYHQDYIKHNPFGGYVQNVSIPEIKDFQKAYPELIKPDHIF